MAGVYDGHGGPQFSNFISKKIHIILDELLKNATSEKEIISAIDKAYELVENELLQNATGAFDLGFNSGTVGSCALTAVVKGNKLFVAQAGDSNAVLISKEGEGFKTTLVSKSFSANEVEEQQRLKKEFPKERDIYVCRS